MNAAMHKEALEANFEDVVKLIWDTIHKFERRYGIGPFGDKDEMFSKACLIWVTKMNAKKYDATRSAFTTWTRLIVWGGLLEDVRTAIRHRNTGQQPAVARLTDYDLLGLTAPEFNTVDFLDELSEDARMIAMLALDTPYEIYLNARLCGDQNDLQASIWDYLRGIGWTASQIRTSFEEVRSALR